MQQQVLAGNERICLAPEAVVLILDASINLKAGIHMSPVREVYQRCCSVWKGQNMLPLIYLRAVSLSHVLGYLFQ